MFHLRVSPRRYFLRPPFEPLAFWNSDLKAENIPLDFLSCRPKARLPFSTATEPLSSRTLAPFLAEALAFSRTSRVRSDSSTVASAARAAAP